MAQKEMTKQQKRERRTLIMNVVETAKAWRTSSSVTAQRELLDAVRCPGEHEFEIDVTEFSDACNPAVAPVTIILTVDDAVTRSAAIRDGLVDEIIVEDYEEELEPTVIDSLGIFHMEALQDDNEEIVFTHYSDWDLYPEIGSDESTFFGQNARSDMSTFEESLEVFENMVTEPGQPLLLLCRFNPENLSQRLAHKLAFSLVAKALQSIDLPDHLDAMFMDLGALIDLPGLTAIEVDTEGNWNQRFLQGFSDMGLERRHNGARHNGARHNGTRHNGTRVIEVQSASRVHGG